MNDCSNADIRDRLPDLMHERLDESMRVVVVTHVAGCVDCREELELLRVVRGALVAAAPRVDIASIVSALPKPGSNAVRGATHRRWVDWRVAAAVTLFVVGGSSVALLSRTPRAAFVDSAVLQPVTAPIAVAPVGVSAQTSPDSSAAPAARGNAAATTAAVNTVADVDVDADGGSDSRFTGLSASQLKALLGDIDHLEALPDVEPEPVSIRVSPGNPTKPDGDW